MVSEQRTTPYYRAATFTGERSAGAAYDRVQTLLFAAPECELSAYRFQIMGIWHVAILGDLPDEGLGQELETALASGTLVSLGSDVLTFLQQRRDEERKQGTWVEHHHRPGLGLSFGSRTVTPPFPLGRLVMTANLQMKLQESDPEHWEGVLKALIARHAAGDWGDLDSHDHGENDNHA